MTTKVKQTHNRTENTTLFKYIELGQCFRLTTPQQGMHNFYYMRRSLADIWPLGNCLVFDMSKKVVNQISSGNVSEDEEVIPINATILIDD